MAILEGDLAIASDAGDLGYEAWCLSSLSQPLWPSGEALRVTDAAEQILANYRGPEPISSRTAAAMSSS